MPDSPMDSRKVHITIETYNFKQILLSYMINHYIYRYIRVFNKLLEVQATRSILIQNTIRAAVTEERKQNMSIISSTLIFKIIVPKISTPVRKTKVMRMSFRPISYQKYKQSRIMELYS